MRRLALAALLALITTAPALAVPFCHFSPGGPYAFNEYSNLGETEQTELYLQQLQRMGIDARQVAYWNECIQAVVREDGRITMRYYDPGTLVEIY